MRYSVLSNSSRCKYLTMCFRAPLPMYPSARRSVAEFSPVHTAYASRFWGQNRRGHGVQKRETRARDTGSKRRPAGRGPPLNAGAKLWETQFGRRGAIARYRGELYQQVNIILYYTSRYSLAATRDHGTTMTMTYPHTGGLR